MRERAAVAGSDNRFKCGLFRAQPAHMIFNLSGDFDFCDAGAYRLQGAIESARIGRDRTPDSSELLLGFHHALALNDGSQRDQREAWKAIGQQSVLLIGQVRLLKAYAPGPQPAQETRGGGQQRAARDDSYGAGNLLRGLNCVARIGEQDRGAGRHDNEAVAACVAGKITDIGGLGDEQSIDAFRSEIEGGRTEGLRHRRGGHGSSSSLPAVFRAARSSWAWAASASL